MDKLTAAAAAASPSTACQTIFLVSALSILSLNLLPRDARSTIMDYGARRVQRPHRSVAAAEVDDDGPRDPLTRLLGVVASRGQVPHDWFWHFYLLSMGLSALWAREYLLRGPAMAFLAERQVQVQIQVGRPRPSADLGRVVVAWAMMAAQGSRRLYESLVVTRPGGSPMLVAHWALGMLFYAVMSVAVWAEGSGAILESWHGSKPAALSTTTTIRVSLALAVFAVAWLKQNECHRYLASLEKYTLPDKGLFRHIVCPHYTCECVIYLAISVVAAPPGRFFSAPVLCGLLLVAVNLGATAVGTKEWYAGKFGADEVAHRWRMIPGIF